MLNDLLHSLPSNLWSIFLVVLFFGGSIFVHELGHFLAARRRGVLVERFSIGFGPPIFSWRGKDGVQYQVAWIPLGGYVLLPQLADLGLVEGESSVKAAENSAGSATPPPSISYGTKMTVFVAGAAFNVLFAFLLACVTWGIGLPENNETATTRIGYISKTLDLPDGSKAPGPAAAAGLQVGDVIHAIDGHIVGDWNDIRETLVTSAGRGADGNPRSVFTVARGSQVFDFIVHPRLAGDEGTRSVGIGPGYDLIVYKVASGSSAERAGVRPGDVLTRMNGQLALNAEALDDELDAAPNRAEPIVVRRDGRDLSLVLPPRDGKHDTAGLVFSTGYRMSHPSPFAQIKDQIVMVFRTIAVLVNPHSDVGLSKVSGPVGIVHLFHEAAEAGIRTMLMITILVNINLAIFNLLPIPVLDGGQMLFATIGRLRGKSIPVNVIATLQSVFIVLLFSMILYVSFFDVRRWSRDVRADREAAAQPAGLTPAAAQNPGGGDPRSGSTPVSTPPAAPAAAR